MNISNLLIESTAHRPEHPAIRFLERTITYKELNRQVDRLSHGLVRAGLHPRDVCVLMMPNSIDWAIVYYALAKIGAVILPVNFLYRKGELEHIFKDSGARAFIGYKDYLEYPRQVMEHLPKMDLRIAQGVSHGQGFSSKLQKLPSIGNYPTSFPLPSPNLGRTYQKVEVGARTISGGPGQEDRGE